MAKVGDIRVGISGWLYKGWRGVFYPRGWPQKRELEYVSRIFRTVESNGTFYSLQRPESFATWAAATPEDFLFAVKGPRFITHMRRLKEAQAPPGQLCCFRGFASRRKTWPDPVAASAQF